MEGERRISARTRGALVTNAEAEDGGAVDKGRV